MHNIARWDGFTWQRMPDEECERTCTHTGDQFVCQDRNCELGGPVTALASTGATVFAAGVFDLAGGRPVRNLAQYFSGTWKPVLGGVVGSVFDLKVFSLNNPPSIYHDSGIQEIECLYVAGDLDRVINQDGISMRVHGLARTCLEADVQSSSWEEIVGAENIGPILALHVPHELGEYTS